MYGHLILHAKPEAVGIKDVSALGTRGENLSRPSLDEVTATFTGSKLEGFVAANNLSHHGHVMVQADGSLKVNVDVVIEPFTETFTCESTWKDTEFLDVMLLCWVSVQRDPSQEALRNGIWKNSRADWTGQVAAVIVNDPSERDNRRRKITLVGKSIKAVREVLFKVLQGEITPDKPWVI